MPRLGLGSRGSIPMKQDLERGGRQGYYRHRCDGHRWCRRRMASAHRRSLWGKRFAKIREVDAMQTHETPASLKTRLHSSAVWYSNCCVLWVSQGRIHVGRTTEKRDPSSSSRIPPGIRRGQRSRTEDGSGVFCKDRVRCHVGNCDLVLGEAAKAQAWDECL